MQVANAVVIVGMITVCWYGNEGTTGGNGLAKGERTLRWQGNNEMGKDWGVRREGNGQPHQGSARATALEPLTPSASTLLKDPGKELVLHLLLPGNSRDKIRV